MSAELLQFLFCSRPFFLLSLQFDYATRSICVFYFKVSDLYNGIILTKRAISHFYQVEGSTIANYGIEGEAFNFDNEDIPQYTGYITNNPDGHGSGALRRKIKVIRTLLPECPDFESKEAFP